MLQPSGLMRRHRLKLVSTSKVCDLKLREARQSAAEAFGEGDAMAVPPAAVQAAQAEIAEGVRRAAGSPAMLAVSRIEPLASTDLAVPAASSSNSSTAVSPVDRVTASLAAAAAAASAAAQGVYSAAAPYTGGSGPGCLLAGFLMLQVRQHRLRRPHCLRRRLMLYLPVAPLLMRAFPHLPPAAGPFANNITTFTASVTASLPLQSVAQQLQSAAAVGHSSAIATVATVSAALESTWGVRCAAGLSGVQGGSGQIGDTGLGMSACTAAAAALLLPQPASACLSCVLPRAAASDAHPPLPAPPLPACRRPGGARAKECQSPAEWFIADDPSSHTRFFVIQGSDNLDHWRVNLTFDPVPWEDAALGIKVGGWHRMACVLGVVHIGIGMRGWGGEAFVLVGQVAACLCCIRSRLSHRLASNAKANPVWRAKWSSALPDPARLLLPSRWRRCTAGCMRPRRCCTISSSRWCRTTWPPRPLQRWARRHGC